MAYFPVRPLHSGAMWAYHYKSMNPGIMNHWKLVWMPFIFISQDRRLLLYKEGGFLTCLCWHLSSFGFPVFSKTIDVKWIFHITLDP